MNVSSSPMQYLVEGLGQNHDGRLFVKVRFNACPWKGSALIEVEAWQARSSQMAVKAREAFGVDAFEHWVGYKRDVDEVIRKGTVSFNVATQPGFCKQSFVLPDGEVYGETICTYIPTEVSRHAHGLRARGALKNWKKVSQLAESNPRLLLALSVALSGPVADYLNIPAPMVNLFGGSRTERAVIARAAASVVGGREEGVVVDNWNDIVSNVEVVTAARHATLLVVNETKASVPVEAIQGTVMRISQDYKNRPHKESQFRVPVLSVSDHSYCEMALGAGLVDGDAYSDGMIDIPFAVGASSAFECLHGAEDTTEFCVMLSNLVRLNYGQALRHLIQRLLKAAETNVSGWLCDRRSYFEGAPRPYVPYAINGGKRVRERFATVYAAGSLAIRYRLLPGTEADLCNALLACERAHLEHLSLLFGACQGDNSKARPN